MKQTYIIPTLTTVEVSSNQLMQNTSTLTINRNDTGRGTDLVKDGGSTSSTSSYNVWNDDWSE